MFPLLSERDALAEEVCTADEVKTSFPIVFSVNISYKVSHIVTFEITQSNNNLVSQAPQEVVDTCSASEGSAKKKRRTVEVTTEDMQKRRNDVKARTTLLLALPDEHQLRFNKYKTA
nr:hypothetical protein [Tanacetum cinerariifolium]